MAELHGRSGDEHILGACIGHGGEGGIYEPEGYRDIVAKLYKQKKTRCPSSHQSRPTRLIGVITLRRDAAVGE